MGLAVLALGWGALVYYHLLPVESRAAIISQDAQMALTIQYPYPGAVFPANSASPPVLWNTNTSGLDRWSAEFTAGGRRWVYKDVQPRWHPPSSEWQELEQAARQESVELVVKAHWRLYGRHYYARHDYDGLDLTVANDLIGSLRQNLSTLKGRKLGSLEISDADDFAYTDPVDGSVADHQGIRIAFTSGARIVYRLSGTGTTGATLRVYLEQFEHDPAQHDCDVQEKLRGLADLAVHLGQIVEKTGRQSPSVVT